MALVESGFSSEGLSANAQLGAGASGDIATGQSENVPAEYELAFEEEARDFVLPAYALHSGTFGCNVPTMLVHAQPEFLRWFVPQVLRGEI